MNQSTLMLLLIFALTPFVESFAPHRRVSHHLQVASTELKEKSSQAHQDIYDAIEAAAFDAHDCSDAGMEAAMMERSVIMASELTAQKAKKPVLLTKDAAPAVSEVDIVEAYDDFVDHIMHFEKGLVDSSTEQIDEGHSTVAAFAHLIEELDE